MFCPQCGQQQVSDVTRYCSRCGFPLDGVAVVLASGGIVPGPQVRAGYSQLSPRSKGVRQGALLMLSTLLIVPLVAIISVFFLRSPELIPITAITCFVGGLLRIFYALLMEDAVAPPTMGAMPGHFPPTANQFEQPVRNAALPPPGANAATGWRQPKTAELYQPPSITENTTRLLDKNEPKDR